MTEDLITLPSGATALIFDDTSDKVTIPGGTPVDNLAAVTWEFLIYWPSGATDVQVLWSKNGTVGGNYQIALLTTGQVRVYRAAVGMNHAYVTAETIEKNAWNHIQVTWAVGVVAGATPIIKINDCLCTVNHTVGSGSGQAWISDAGPMLVGSFGDTTYTFMGTLAVFRFHSVVLANAQLHTNYLADWWRTEFYQLEGLTGEARFIANVPTIISPPLPPTPPPPTPVEVIEALGKWDLIDPLDYIRIPHSSAIANLQNVTLEFLIYRYSGNSTYGWLWSKGGFEIWIEAGGRLGIKRKTQGAVPYDYDEWITPAGAVSTGLWCYLQISWAAGTAPGTTPVVHINNAAQTMAHNHAGTGNWTSDANDDVYIGNNAALDHNLYVAIALFRLYNTANASVTLINNYWGDFWILNGGYQVGYVPAEYQPPLLQIGKNLSALDVQVDHSSVVTRLYPRGTGQSPSELTLDNPPYYPKLQKLKLQKTDADYAYFTLPDDYAAYDGWVTDGDALPSGMLIGNGTGNLLSIDQSVNSGVGFGAGSSWLAQTFTASSKFRIYDVWLYLVRWQGAKEYRGYGDYKLGSTWPRIEVGLYNLILSRTWPTPLNVPYQGPLVSSICDLRSISPVPYLTPLPQMEAAMSWYRFPMQSAEYPAGNYAIAIHTYPNSASWAQDVILWGGRFPSTFPGGTGVETSYGNHPDAWRKVREPEGEIDFNVMVNAIGPDVTPDFVQGKDAHTVKLIRSSYVPGSEYRIHYKQASHLTAWDQLDYYGIIHGTMKDDALKSQESLFNAASKYLQKISQPVKTWSTSAIDLYDLDPSRNWSDELKLGSEVLLMDDLLTVNVNGEPANVSGTFIITKKQKNNLELPHDVQLQLDNVVLNAPKYMANLTSGQLTPPKYISGQTVATPFVASTQCDAANPAVLYFEIVSTASLIHSVELSLHSMPFQVAGSSGLSTSTAASSFELIIDGRSVSKSFAPTLSFDILEWLTKTHTGQPTPGLHEVKVIPLS